MSLLDTMCVILYSISFFKKCWSQLTTADLIPSNNSQPHFVKCLLFGMVYNVLFSVASPNRNATSSSPLDSPGKAPSKHTAEQLLCAEETLW